MKMAIGTTKFCKCFQDLRQSFLQSYVLHSISSSQTLLEESIQAAIKTKTYHQIPDLLSSTIVEPKNNFNPFSFLSTFSNDLKTQIIDEILQSFITLRPRTRPHLAHAYLLSHTLQNPNPLPIALAVLQRTLRSGAVPVPQTHLSLSSAWLDRRRQSQSVSDILSDLRSIGYFPDRSTCNYLIASLCAVDQWTEAVRVLKEMGGAGCEPDSESYSLVIGKMCERRKSGEAVELVKEMVGEIGLTPKQRVLVRVVAAMRANREIRGGVEMIEFLERRGCNVGFESYEMVVEGCLERGEFVLGGKVVMAMVGRGFLPYIGVRQRVFEGLIGVGQWKLACAVRQRLAQLNS
ncbi:hypothetical protein HHK36_005063 [Tetracentron sinense]|uniref:Pentatricopeptide repeat-containing protein n=1 Tax=Tetracentron sinense TaxID=13715 RepID=A0A835DQS7_TETSI|nr:hypothetical protein HHK36_005063 [Tetracentron sinense]